MPTEIAGRGRDVLHARQAQQADRQVAHRRHRVRTPPACAARTGSPAANHPRKVLTTPGPPAW
jgi:hypothetical protein